MSSLKMLNVKGSECSHTINRLDEYSYFQIV